MARVWVQLSHKVELCPFCSVLCVFVTLCGFNLEGGAMRLRSTVNPEEQTNLVGGPTRYKKGPNQSRLVCGFCGDPYYVDEITFEQAMHAMDEGIDNPFCCDECEAEYEEISH
jgi:hypothetical protein